MRTYTTRSPSTLLVLLVSLTWSLAGAGTLHAQDTTPDPGPPPPGSGLPMDPTFGGLWPPKIMEEVPLPGGGVLSMESDGQHFESLEEAAVLADLFNCEFDNAVTPRVGRRVRDKKLRQYICRENEWRAVQLLERLYELYLLKQELEGLSEDDLLDRLRGVETFLDAAFGGAVTYGVNRVDLQDALRVAFPGYDALDAPPDNPFAVRQERATTLLHTYTGIMRGVRQMARDLADVDDLIRKLVDLTREATSERQLYQVLAQLELLNAEESLAAYQSVALELNADALTASLKQDATTDEVILLQALSGR